MALMLAAAALAQPFDPAVVPKADTPPSTVPIASLPPAQKLGLRVNLLDRQTTVIPTVVIVPNEASYLGAIARWQTSATGAIRYPVLIDNGTWAARTRIARFVRAFNPKSIMRWTATGDAAAFPEDPQLRQLRIETVAAAAWGSTPPDLNKKWTELGFIPPGVVVCNLKDPAWTAAVALAAGRGQPIIWADLGYPGDPAGFIYPPVADAFGEKITKGVEATGRSWNSLGDDIEAVTLCMTTPTRVFLGDGDKRKFFALTDWIGRNAPTPPIPATPSATPAPIDTTSKRPRWAWCGQIMGDSARAAHDAMCALFLVPDRGWFFDGYPSSEPWNQFDMTAAASQIEKIGVKCLVDDAPGGGTINDLRRRATGVRQSTATSPTDAGMGVDAGLIAINTKGNADFFTLADGDAKPVDIPILRRPAIAYVVHSFSAASPTSRPTVAGILIERGVYAYLGSVEEPYLNAFVPTPLAMNRLVSGFPWGAAGRLDGGDLWKLAVFGDPLLTLGPPGKRATTSAVPLPGATDVAAALPDQLKARDFESAMWTLAIVGRDRDAARLLAALCKDDPTACTPAVALAGIPSAFFTGDYATFVLGARKVAPVFEDDARVKREGIAEIRDMVWHAVSMSAGKITESEADLLADYLRPDLLGRDTSDATRAAELVKGMGAGRAVRDKSVQIELRSAPRRAPPSPEPTAPVNQGSTPGSTPSKP